MEMREKWIPLMRYAFVGPRFEDHGLDLECLGDLLSLRELLVETAKELWRRENPERERLPKGYDEKLRLRFFRIEDGSAAVPICYRVDEPIQMELSAEDSSPDQLTVKLPIASQLVVDAVKASDEARVLPSELPRNVIQLMCKLGQNLNEDEEIRLMDLSDQNTERVATLTIPVRERIGRYVEIPWEDSVDQVGVVTMANLKGKATLDVNGNTVDVVFNPEQERTITGALHEHNCVKVRIIGRGEFNQGDGLLRKVTKVDHIERIEGKWPRHETDTRPIWEVISDISAQVEEEEWAKLPRDGAENLDHYLYEVPTVGKSDK